MKRLGPDHALLVHEGVVVLLARSAPSALMIKQVERTILSTASGRSAGAAMLYILIGDRSSGRFEEGMRDELRGVAKRSAKSIASFSIVVLRDGFIGSAFRSVITSMMLALRPHFPSRVHATIQAGVLWLAETRAKNEPLDVALLEQTVLQAHEALMQDA